MKIQALTFVDYLEQMRQYRGLSVAQLEASSLIKHDCWRNNATCRKQPSFHRIISVCKALRCRLVITRRDNVIGSWNAAEDPFQISLELLSLADGARESHGFTRRQFSLVCGMAGDAWNRYCKGLSGMSLHKYISAISALGLVMEVICNEDA
jgi:hypothetical protein